MAKASYQASILYITSDYCCSHDLMSELIATTGKIFNFFFWRARALFSDIRCL